MRKAQRIRESCDYKGLVDGSLLRSLRRHSPHRNIHGIIFDERREFTIDRQNAGHASDGFLIGIMRYKDIGNLHTHHAVSALLIQGRLYLFNAHGNRPNTPSMEWLVYFIRNHGVPVDSFVEYSGPDLQATDYRGVCTAFASRFLKLHPNASMNQDDFNRYVFEKLSGYTLNELGKYIETVSSIRNVGSSSNNNNVNNRNRRRKVRNVPRNMNINGTRPRRMNINSF